MLTSEQSEIKDFILEFLNSNVSSKKIFDPDQCIMISGSGGTGKTYTITRAIKEFSNKNKETIAFAAPTHNARRELQKSLNDAYTYPPNAYTNASLFGIEYSPLSGRSYLKELSAYYEPPVFNCDILILDEYSMLGGTQLTLMKERFSQMLALGIDLPKIIFTGDYAQIPPVIEDKSPTDYRDGEITNLLYHDRKDRVRGLFTNMRAKYDDIASISTTIRAFIDRVNAIVLYKNSEEEFADVLSDFHQFVEEKQESENVNYYNLENKNEWLESYLQSFKESDNLRFGVIVTYNNANHPSTIALTSHIRKELFNTTKKYVEGDLLMVASNSYTARYYNRKTKSRSGEFTLGKEERLKVLEVSESTKHFSFSYRKKGDKRERGFSAKLPIYELVVENDEGTCLMVTVLNSTRKLSSYFKNGVFLTEGLQDFKITGELPENVNQVYALLSSVLLEVEYAYVVNSHKVQGSSYDQTFVEEDNILTARNFKEKLQLLYTAYSRSKYKTHSKSNNCLIHCSIN